MYRLFGVASSLRRIKVNNSIAIFVFHEELINKWPEAKNITSRSEDATTNPMQKQKMFGVASSLRRIKVNNSIAIFVFHEKLINKWPEAKNTTSRSEDATTNPMQKQKKFGVASSLSRCN